PPARRSEETFVALPLRLSLVRARGECSRRPPLLATPGREILRGRTIASRHSPSRRRRSEKARMRRAARSAGAADRARNEEGLLRATHSEDARRREAGEGGTLVVAGARSQKPPRVPRSEKDDRADFTQRGRPSPRVAQGGRSLSSGTC